MTHARRSLPYWWEEAPLSDAPPTPLPARADAAVVGAGYAGLAAAIELARAGRHAVVLERDRPGEGASTRNGGIASGNIRLGFGDMIRRFGLARAVAVYGEGRAARRDLTRFVEAERIRCDFEPAGRFHGAVVPRHYEAMGREADLLNRHLDVGAVMVPRSSQHDEIGSDRYHGGMLRPDIGGLHPAKLHRGMLARALDCGAEVHAHTPVTRMHREPWGFVVHTTRGAVSARDVVVCTNGYTGRATPWLHRRIVPIASEMIATEPLSPGLMARLMPKRRMLGESRRIYHYFRPSPDGTRILLGGKRIETRARADARHHLVRALIEVFPQLDGVGVSHDWWGWTGQNFDHLPRLTVHEGVHYATGFCGSGVVWARWLGRKAALRILDDPDWATAFDTPQFSTRPLYHGRPWFVPAVLGWYALRDRLER